jgi:hypothetical protein
MVRLTTVDEALTYFTRRGLTRESTQDLFLVKPDGSKSKTTTEFKDMDKTIANALKDSGHTIESNTVPAKALTKQEVLDALPKSLNPVYRLWAFMHFTKSNADIAKVLDIKEDSVRVRMIRLLGSKTHTLQALLPMVLATGVDISYIFPEGSLTNARLNAWFGEVEATVEATDGDDVTPEVDEADANEAEVEPIVTDEPLAVIAEPVVEEETIVSEPIEEADVIPEGDTSDDEDVITDEVADEVTDSVIPEAEYVDCKICEDGDTDYVCIECDVKSKEIDFDEVDSDNTMNTSILAGDDEPVIESLPEEAELPEVEDIPMAADSGGGLDDMNF